MTVIDVITVKGTDISKWQGAVDFVKMKQMGIEFVIIRAGYGETEDKMFTAYINAALMAGLAVGVYWFIYAKDSAGAGKNADKLNQVVKPYKDRITCGVWADWEYDSDGKAGPLTKKQRSDIVGEFCRITENYGYEAGIYANQDYIQNKFTKELVAAYPLWFARYSEKMGSAAYQGRGGHPYIWQYSSKGYGADYGVSSKYIDLDYAYFEMTGKNTFNDKMSMVNPFEEPAVNVKRGTRGEGAKWVQWHLWRFGILQQAGDIDGIIGKISDAGIREAQRRLGLTADGIVGQKTRAAWKSLA